MRPPKLANAVNDLSLTWRMAWPDYGERRQEGTTDGSGRTGQYLLRILSEDNREMGGR
jgi:hypothetical protein